MIALQGRRAGWDGSVERESEDTQKTKFAVVVETLQAGMMTVRIGRQQTATGPDRQIE
jgi:hypothetical protein